MASFEKNHRKSSAFSSSSSSLDNFNESARDFLLVSNTTSIIKSALSALFNHQPDDPIQFLIEYFERFKPDPITVSCKKLTRFQFQEMGFMSNILDVYNDLTSLENEDTDVKGLLGKQFNELLEKLSENLLGEQGNMCLIKLQYYTRQVVSFKRFYRSILTMHVIKKFIQIIEKIYVDLNFSNDGTACNDLCKAVLYSLDNYISCYSLGTFNSELNLNLYYPPSNSPQECHQRMTKSKFIDDALKIFVKLI